MDKNLRSTVKIHDFWREFCLKESQMENFLHAFPSYWKAGIKYAINHPEFHHPRRLVIDANLGMFLKFGFSWPSTRSFFCFEGDEPINLEDCSATFFKSLEILDMQNVHLISLPTWIQVLTKLKYLALTVQNSVSLTELSKLQKLQTCIIDGEWIGQLSRELWDMSELRHFSVKRTLLLSHQWYASKGLLPVLQNLQSLYTIVTASCTKEIFLSMPNLKKLGVCATKDEHRFCDWFENLVHLRKLEKLTFSNPFASSQISPDHLPSCCDVILSKLKKLTLSGTSLPWEDMHQLSKLRHLEELKLKNFAFSGVIWNAGNSKFFGVTSLLIDSTDLEIWLADYSNFPLLQHLVLRHCRSLRFIPHGLSAFQFLKVELHCCPDSVVTSAEQLKQQNPYRVNVHVTQEDET